MPLFSQEYYEGLSLEIIQGYAADEMRERWRAIVQADGPDIELGAKDRLIDTTVKRFTPISRSELLVLLLQHPTWMEHLKSGDKVVSIGHVIRTEVSVLLRRYLQGHWAEIVGEPVTAATSEVSAEEEPA